MLLSMIALLVLATAAVATPEPTSTSTVAFEIHTKHDQGPVRCGLYDTKKSWLGRGYRFRATARSHGRRAVCVFDGVPAGRYAAVAYHDKNDNGELDRNFLGLPEEDFAFSEGVKAGLGPPSFDSAALEVRGGYVRTRGSM